MLNIGADVFAGVDVMTRDCSDELERVETTALLADGCVTLASDPVVSCVTVVNKHREEAVAKVFVLLITGSASAFTACVDIRLTPVTTSQLKTVHHRHVYLNGCLPGDLGLAISP